jgi:stearoyl-CoA desaturase (delta-9 desaturase)
MHHRPSITPFLLAVWACALAYALVDGPSEWWIAAYGIHFFLFTFGVGFGLHRILAHKASNPPAWIRNFAALTGVVGQGGSPMSWQTTHLMHHARADREGDPHAPSLLGRRVLLGAAEPVPKDYVIERALREPGLRDPFLLFLHKHYYFFGAAYAAAAVAAFGLHGLVYLAILPMGLSMLSLNFLNYFAHSGKQPRNVWWLFPLTFGENWHANHHRHPAAQNSGERFFEIDLIGWIYFGLTRPFCKKEFPESATACRESR